MTSNKTLLMCWSLLMRSDEVWWGLDHISVQWFNTFTLLLLPQSVLGDSLILTDMWSIHSVYCGFSLTPDLWPLVSKVPSLLLFLFPPAVAVSQPQGMTDSSLHLQSSLLCLFSSSGSHSRAEFTVQKSHLACGHRKWSSYLCALSSAYLPHQGV